MVNDLSEMKEGCTVAFVHAKGVSERLPGKNLKMLGDDPLVVHAVRNAIDSEVFDAVVIDSEDDDILRYGVSYGALGLKREHWLGTNETTGDDLAYWQCRAVPQASCVVQVVPTSPFIKPETIRDAVELFRANDDVNSVVGCRCQQLYTWRDGQPGYRPGGQYLPNSTELPETLHETTGPYVMNPRQVVKNGLRVDFAPHCVPYFFSPVESIDINDEADWELAELVWKGKNA